MFFFPVQLITSRIDNLTRLNRTVMTIHTYYRALSLRKLVLGYEGGRVLPVGLGPGSPSRDAANWLSLRFSPAVGTRRRYGWLRKDGIPRWHAKGREHCRGEPGSALSGGYAPYSLRAESSSIIDEPGEC